MSRIGDLIQELCPNGVQLRALGDVASYSSTRVASTELDIDTFVGVDNLLAGKAGLVAATYRPNTDTLTEFRPGDILIGNIRPYLKKIWLADRRGGCSGDVLAVRILPGLTGELTSEFLYYVLSSDAFFAYDVQHARGAKMPRGNKQAILRFPVPVPPIQVQREIVRVLDLFQSLEAKLEAELEARRHQYDHYRDALMAFSGQPDVQWVPLGELGEIFRGRRFLKSDYVSDGIGCMHYGELYTTYGTSATTVVSHVRPELAPNLRFAQPGDVVIAEVGETVEEVGKAVAWVGDEEIAIHDGCFGFRHSINPVYVSYCLQTAAFHSQKRKFVARAKVKRLSLPGLAKIAIPVPSIEDQERIVAILDPFNALVNDMSVGLPAELAARRMQYEYYRDRLLSFEAAA